MASSSAAYVCWERMRDDMMGLSPFQPEDSYEIEKAYSMQPTNTVVLSTFTINFLKMREEKHLGRGSDHHIRRNTGITLPSKGITGYWMWCNQTPSGFVPYDIEASVDIEQGYQNYVNGHGKEILNLANCPCRIPYTVNFSNMNQTRHRFQTVRGIKRVQLPMGQTLQYLLTAHCKADRQVNAVSLTPLHPTSASATSAPLGGVISVGGASHISVSAATTGNSSLLSAYGGGGPKLTTPNTSSTGGLSTSSSLLDTNPRTSGSSKYMPPSSSLGRGGAMGTSTGTSSSSRPSSGSKSKSRKKQTSASGKMSPTTSSKSSKKPARRRRKKKAELEEEEEAVAGGVQLLMAHFKRVKKLKEKEDEPCPICMSALSEPSGFDDEVEAVPLSATPTSLNVYKLRRCGHKLHHSCLQMYLKQGQQSGFQCPTCKKSYGVKTGDMPDGSMSVRKSRQSLPGHSDCGSVEITYDFKPGRYKGVQFYANGFPRTCYLPDSPKGQKVLRLLRVAWERRLTFTIGTSVTTGANSTVVWNEIHHKTEARSNYSGHGYPDTDYLDRVLLELAAQGVEDNQDEEVESSSSDDSDVGGAHM